MMKKIKFYSIFITLLTLSNLIISALICFFTNKRNLVAYSNTLCFASGIFLLIGLMSYIGTARKAYSNTYQSARTILSVSKEDLDHEDLAATNHSMEIFMVAVCTGTISMIVSALILKLV